MACGELRDPTRPTPAAEDVLRCRTPESSAPAAAGRRRCLAPPDAGELRAGRRRPPKISRAATAGEPRTSRRRGPTLPVSEEPLASEAANWWGISPRRSPDER
ncbi:unnamed protein product [Urochloa humidicola]